MQSSFVEAQIFPNVTSNTTTALFLSNRRISYPGRFTSELVIVWSSFDSAIPIIAALVLLAMHLISTFFERKLLMFI